MQWLRCSEWLLAHRYAIVKRLLKYFGLMPGGYLQAQVKRDYGFFCLAKITTHMEKKKYTSSQT